MLDAYMIAWLRYKGLITIDPFVPGCLGPNSYDVHLSPWIAEVTPADPPRPFAPSFPRGDTGLREGARDFAVNPAARAAAVVWKRLSPGGFPLLPGAFYLGSTVEVAGATADVVPHIDGRSSVGRMGVRVHATAGRGDVGFVGHWTLELDIAGSTPVWVYPGMRVGQLSFHALDGHGIPRPPPGDRVFHEQGLGSERAVRSLRYRGNYRGAATCPHADVSRYVYAPEDVPTEIARAVTAIREVYPVGVRKTQTPAQAAAAFDAYRAAILATRPEGVDFRVAEWARTTASREGWGL
jgi:dCTP deaminase